MCPLPNEKNIKGKFYVEVMVPIKAMEPKPLLQFAYNFLGLSHGLKRPHLLVGRRKSQNFVLDLSDICSYKFLGQGENITFIYNWSSWEGNILRKQFFGLGYFKYTINCKKQILKMLWLGFDLTSHPTPYWQIYSPVHIFPFCFYFINNNWIKLKQVWCMASCSIDSMLIYANQFWFK